MRGCQGIMNSKGCWRKRSWPHFRFCPGQFAWGAEENHEKPQVRIAGQSRYEPGTSWIRGEVNYSNTSFGYSLLVEQTVGSCWDNDVYSRVKRKGFPLFQGFHLSFSVCIFAAASNTSNFVLLSYFALLQCVYLKLCPQPQSEMWRLSVALLHDIWGPLDGEGARDGLLGSNAIVDLQSDENVSRKRSASVFGAPAQTPLGKPFNTWEDNIKMGTMDGTHLTRNRNR